MSYKGEKNSLGMTIILFNMWTSFLLDVFFNIYIYTHTKLIKDAKEENERISNYSSSKQSFLSLGYCLNKKIIVGVKRRYN